MYTIKEFIDVENMLEDKLSKLIYNNIVLYRYSGKYEYIYQITQAMNASMNENERRDLGTVISRNKERQIDDIVIYGAGVIGKKVLSFLQQYHICPKYFIDQNAIEGQVINGVPVYLPNHAVSEHGNIYIIAAIDTLIKESMKSVLLSYGVEEEKMFLGISGFPNQYFDEVIKIEPDMVWVDGGGYIGDTAIDIARKTNNTYRKIISFEPDKHNIALYKANIQKEKLGNIQLEPYGLWDKQENLKFSNDPIGGGSRIEEAGETRIDTISIDEVLKGEACDFIKMDIEGAELKALMGAKKTIKKYRPQLAICIYHKPEDYVEIPKYIKELFSGYKLYIRHYTNYDLETVLYAIP